MALLVSVVMESRSRKNKTMIYSQATSFAVVPVRRPWCVGAPVGPLSFSLVVILICLFVSAHLKNTFVVLKL